jgi:hypothetical protein
MEVFKADPETCSVRTVLAADGTAIPVPVGGLGLPDGTSVNISEAAEVQINKNDDGSFIVVLNNGPGVDDEATRLFGELSQETAISELESLAASAFTKVPTIAIEAAGLLLGVLASVFTSSALTREIFMKCDLDTGTATDGPPVTYCLLLSVG